MSLRFVRLLVCLSLLLPSAWYAWRWKEMPHAGYYQDDALYYVSAQSLAEGEGYTIGSLPGSPAQTKYPPLWPLVLSIAWRLEPHYPDNLPIAMWLSWMWLPLTLVAYRAWLRNVKAGEDTVLLLSAAWVLNPYVILFSATMLSEMMFTALLLACLLCLRPRRIPWTIAAAALAGLAFLTRSAGLALLPAAVLWLLRRREGRRAVAFAVTMTPFIAAWFAWSAENRVAGSDEITLYYTDYFGYYLSIMEWKEIHLYLWRNIDGVLHGFGALLLPDVNFSIVEKVVALTIGVAGVAGVIRLAREQPRSPIALYAGVSAIYLLMLIVWHFPPNERFVLPIAPLWMFGIHAELSRLFLGIRRVFNRPDVSQRIAGGVLAACLGGILVACGWRQWNLLTSGLSSTFENHARHLRDSETTFEWIRSHVPSEAHLFAEMDTAVYFRTGRRGAGYLLNTIHWYRGDAATQTNAYGHAGAYSSRHGLQYLLLNDWDFSRDVSDDMHREILRRIRADPHLELLFASGPSAVYRVR